MLMRFLVLWCAVEFGFVDVIVWFLDLWLLGVGFVWFCVFVVICGCGGFAGGFGIWLRPGVGLWLVGDFVMGGLVCFFVLWIGAI